MFTKVGFVAVLATVVSAQIGNNTVASSTAQAVVAATTVSSTAPAPTSLSSCAVQST